MLGNFVKLLKILKTLSLGLQKRKFMLSTTGLVPSGADGWGESPVAF